MPERTDYHARPPRQRESTPETQYPTPNINDVVIVEDVKIGVEGYTPIQYGTPRFNDSTSKLVWQGPVRANNSEVYHRRVWSTTRSAQEAYNAAVRWQESPNHPVFIRRSLELRADVPLAAGLHGVALTRLISLALAAGGSGYSNEPGAAGVIFHSSIGSGATGTAEVQNGSVVALTLTSGGEGYSAVPIVEVVPIPWAAVTFSGQPSDNDTIVVGLRTYRFKSTLAANDDVQIGATNLLTAANLNKAIMLSGTNGVDYQIVTGANASFTSTVSSGVVSVSRQNHATSTLTDGAANMTIALSAGSGATATAGIQPQTALLVSTESDQAEGELASLFVWMTRVYRTLPGLVLTRHLIDAETQSAVTIEIQEVETPGGAYTQAAGSVIEFEPINSVYGRKITTTLASYAGLSRVVDDYVMFPFPRLIQSASPYQVTARNGSVQTGINFFGRDRFEALARVRTTVTYHASKAAADTAAAAIPITYAPIFNTLRYPGVFFRVNEQSVLNDVITIGPFSTGTTNPTFGSITEVAVTFTASTPSASGYIALIGTDAVIGHDIKPWKYNLWRLETRRVRLR